MGHFQVPFASFIEEGTLSHQELPKVRPKTVVRFSRERQSYSVHYSDYVPSRWWMVSRDVGFTNLK